LCCYYQQGKLHGVHNTWFKNVSTTTSINSNINTHIDDTTINISINDDGNNNYQLATHHTYDNSKKSGLWKEWWPNGNVRRECGYLDDVKHGFCEERDQSGKSLYRSLYSHGKRSKNHIMEVN